MAVDAKEKVGGRGGGGLTGGGMKLEKKLGQHLLKNPGVLDKIIQASGITSSDTVLEIGPGTGNLTLKLLPLARKVIAVDVDERMVSEVKKKAFSLGFRNLEAREGDALRSEFGKFDVCTANLPYQISSPFVFRLLAHRPLFRCAVLMFQKEFAERMLASPSTAAYCRLSVNCQLFCKVSRVCKVAAGSFYPPPKVDSMVVKLTPRDPQPQINFREWDGLVRIAFHRKHRTLRACFCGAGTRKMLETNYNTWRTLSGSSFPELSSVEFRAMVEEALKEANVVDKRAADLPLEAFFEILLVFNRRGVHFVGLSPAAVSADGRPSAFGVTAGEANPLEGMNEFMFKDDEDQEMADAGAKDDEE